MNLQFDHAEKLRRQSEYDQIQALENSPMRLAVNEEIRKILRTHFEKTIPKSHETREGLIQQSVDHTLRHIRGLHAHKTGQGVGEINLTSMNEISDSERLFPQAWWLVKAEAYYRGLGRTDETAIEEIKSKYEAALLKAVK